MTNSAQKEFDNKYISSSEIIKRLRINRPTISQAPKKGLLPEPIVVNNGLIHLWERSIVEPMLKAWEKALTARRSYNT